MHAAIYRRQLLLDCGLSLPKKTFYVDNLYVYNPLPYVNTFYYLNADLYHYYIGRSDQSVNEKVMIGRIDQQLRVNRLMMESVDLTAVRPEKKRAYMRNYLEIITAVSSILLVKAGTEEALAKKEALWADMKRDYPAIHRELRRRPLGILVHLPGAWGRKMIMFAYAVSNKIFGFN